jgi:HAD superfamily hydrolase (TIGR01509 family)
MIVKAIVLDMDGLMVDSEPLWRQSEIELFSTVGLSLTEEMCIQTTGIRIDEVCELWFRRQPWSGPSPLELSKQMIARVVELFLEKGEALPGVHEIIAEVKKRGLPLALASSSPMSMIEVITGKLGIKDQFDIMRSAADEEYGKPHPAVYINTVKDLQIPADFCLTFEDTMAGVISAKAANMKVAAVPQEEHRHDKRYILADFQLKSLLDFDWSEIQ